MEWVGNLISRMLNRNGNGNCYTGMKIESHSWRPLAKKDRHLTGVETNYMSTVIRAHIAVERCDGAVWLVIRIDETAAVSVT